MYNKTQTKEALKINEEVLNDWLRLNEMSLAEICKDQEIKCDPGNVSKMLRGEIPTPKHIMEKFLRRTRISHKILLDFS